jgi:isocitrate dehydrogenase
VLRDYLTDLFPILELGTSAKMLSIVPLMNGGGLFETGAGGSRPSTCSSSSRRTTCAGTRSASSSRSRPRSSTSPRRFDNAGARCWPTRSTPRPARFLEEGRSPSRKVGELDNRGSHFYLALYWAQELAEQTDDASSPSAVRPAGRALGRARAAIVDELNAVQGEPVDIGGYYWPDRDRLDVLMRPSPTFNVGRARGARPGARGYRRASPGPLSASHGRPPDTRSDGAAARSRRAAPATDRSGGDRHRMALITGRRAHSANAPCIRAYSSSPVRQTR